MRQRHREATASDSNSPKKHRRRGYLANVLIKLVVFTLFRCISAGLFAFCFDSVAAPRAAAWALRSSTCGEQRAAPQATARAPRLSICDAKRAAPRAMARFATIKYNGLGATIKYLLSTTSGAAGNGVGTTIKYLRRTSGGIAGSGLSRHRGLLTCPFNTSAPHSSFLCVPPSLTTRTALPRSGV
jgi:hypothetical protein